MKYMYYIFLITSALHAAHMDKGLNALKHIATQRANALFTMLSCAHETPYLGEAVSQLEHALQCAALARHHKASANIQIACLFHDIGHQLEGPRMGELGTARHEDLGAQFMFEQGFDKEVITLTQGHVDAKRYLVSTDQAYYQRLSIASKETLTYQGGMMSVQEMKAFEQKKYAKEMLFLRSCDELAKCPHARTPHLETYFPLVVKHLYKQMKHNSR